MCCSVSPIPSSGGGNLPEARRRRTYLHKLKRILFTGGNPRHRRVRPGSRCRSRRRRTGTTPPGVLHFPLRGMGLISAVGAREGHRRPAEVLHLIVKQGERGGLHGNEGLQAPLEAEEEAKADEEVLAYGVPRSMGIRFVAREV